MSYRSVVYVDTIQGKLEPIFRGLMKLVRLKIMLL